MQATVAIYDYHAFMTTVLDNPTQYGFANATCAGDGGPECIWWAPNEIHAGYTFQQKVANDMLGEMGTLGW